MEDAVVREIYRIGAMITVRQKVVIVLGAGVGLACGFGAVFLPVLGIFLKPMADSYNLSRGDIAVLPMVGMVGSAIGAALVGFIAGRTGWSKTIAFSIMFFSLGLLSMSATSASLSYIFFMCFLTGIFGAATSSAGYIAVISLVFNNRLGMALAFSMIGIGVGATVMPIIADKLLNAMDWRQSYACLAGLCLVLGVIAHQLIFRTLKINRPDCDASGGESVDTSSGNIHGGEGISIGRAIRSYRYWLIAVVAFTISGMTIGGLVHMAAWATDQGISPARAAQSAGLVGLGMGIARFGVGFILDKVFAPLVSLVASLFGAAGFYLLTTDISQSEWMLAMAAILVGFANGAEGDIIPFLARRYFGVKDIGIVYGTLFTFAVLGAALGIYGYGWSFDLLQSYTPIHQVSAVLLCVCSLAILTLGPYQFGSSRDGH